MTDFAIREIHPPDHVRTSGRTTSSALEVSGSQRLVFMSGQVGADESGRIAGESDLAAQLTQSYRNIEALVRTAGGSMLNVVTTTAYVTSVDLVETYRQTKARLATMYWGRGPYPANTLVVVTALVDPRYLVEVAATAAI